jgi:cytochrome c oxidase subunit IV
MAATIAEVIVFYSVPTRNLVYELIGALALVNGVLIATFSMNLKDEPRLLHYLILAPVVLVFVVILAMVFSLPTLPA